MKTLTQMTVDDALLLADAAMPNDNMGSAARAMIVLAAEVRRQHRELERVYGTIEQMQRTIEVAEATMRVCK